MSSYKELASSAKDASGLYSRKAALQSSTSPIHMSDCRKKNQETEPGSKTPAHQIASGRQKALAALPSQLVLDFPHGSRR